MGNILFADRVQNHKESTAAPATKKKLHEQQSAQTHKSITKAPQSHKSRLISGSTDLPDDVRQDEVDSTFQQNCADDDAQFHAQKKKEIPVGQIGGYENIKFLFQNDERHKQTAASPSSTRKKLHVRSDDVNAIVHNILEKTDNKEKKRRDLIARCKEKLLKNSANPTGATADVGGRVDDNGRQLVAEDKKDDDVDMKDNGKEEQK